MVDSRKIVKVFLASPSDLQDERRAAKSVVDEFNKLWADRFGYHVELVGWEDTTPGYGRPQALINRDLAQCELFIGMMWKRWGTPPSNSGGFSSGFEEEFETSISSRRSSERPEISLFFKEIGADLLRDPGEELQKVLKFRNRIISEKEILFQEFSNISEFTSQIRACTTAYVQKLEKQEAGELSDKSQTQPSAETQAQSVAEATSAPETSLSNEGTAFLREFIAKAEQNGGQDAITSVEIARLRLLAKVMGKQGNDERSLGVHDTNLLFAARSELALGYGEVTGLIDAGLESFSSENTPLWHWVAKADGLKGNFLPLTALVGTTSQRIGAFSAMTLISEPLHSEPIFGGITRKMYFEYCLANDVASPIKVAALEYLAECGIPSDLPTVKDELARNNYQTTGPAINAILQINLRQSREQAIRTLYELQPETVDRSLVSKIFKNGAAISAELLSEGAIHRSAVVRASAVALLRARGSLKNELAEKLISDDDAEVRYQALNALIKSGKTFSDNEARGILIKPTARGINPFGLLADADGTAKWNQYSEEKMAATPDHELEAVAALAEAAIDQDARFILDERRFATRGQKLRACMDDNFKAEFSEAYEKLASTIGSEADSVKKIKTLEESLRKTFSRKALDIICKKGEPEDLNRVRVVLASGFVNYSEGDIHYLQKNGEWKDITLIINLVQRPEPGATLLSFPSSGKYRAAASAIYALGRTRLEELYAMTMPGQLLAYLIAETTDVGFKSLQDSTISNVLHSDADQVRKAAALRCIRSLPKNRLSKLLDDYILSDAQRYYNVTHWLDLGVSILKGRAQKAAAKVIEQTWRR